MYAEIDQLDDYIKESEQDVDFSERLSSEEAAQSEYQEKIIKSEFEHEPQPLFDCLFCTRASHDLLLKVNSESLYAKYNYEFLYRINFEPIATVTDICSLLT